MSELKFYRTYESKLKNFDSFIDELENEYLAIEAFLDNFYIRELYEQIMNHESVRTITYNDDEVKVLAKEVIIPFLTQAQKGNSDLKISFKIANMVKLLSTKHIPEPTSSTKRVFDSIELHDTVKVRVGAILPYGAMVTLVSEPSISGIIHISEIIPGFVSDVGNYFEFGQEVEAKVVKKINEDFRLNLSTKETFEMKILDEDIVEEINFNREQEAQSIQLPPELSEIEEFVTSKAGELSNNAKLKLVDLIDEFGVFKFSMKICAASEDLNTDVGIMFLNELEEVLVSN